MAPLTETRYARQLRVIEYITNVLSVVVPATMVCLAVYWYAQRSYGYALFNVGLAAFNIGFTIGMQRRLERLRREWQAKMRELEAQIMRES